MDYNSPWGHKSACSAGDMGLIPGSGRSLEKEMATHSNILAWRIPWTEEPCGLQSMGSQESDITEWLSFHYVGCIYIYNCYIFFLDWSFDHYLVSFVSFHRLYFKVYFIWYEYCYSCFLFGLHLHEISFSSPSLSVSLCPFVWGGSLVDSVDRCLVLVSIQPVFVFWLGHSAYLLFFFF